MHLKIVGKPSKCSLPLIKKGAHFFAKYLLDSKSLYKKIDLVICFKKDIDNCYGICDWLGESPSRPKEFKITLDPDLSKKETLLALAHEMVHVKQYAKGEMRDIWRPSRTTKWLGERYEHEKFDYWEQPWEIEAYGRERGLYLKFLYYIKQGEPEILCRPLRPIKSTYR